MKDRCQLNTVITLLSLTIRLQFGIVDIFNDRREKMSLKSAKRTAERVITMVESGDYDSDRIIHMVESLSVGRDRRIRYMEGKVKDRKFEMTLKIVSGALRDTVKHHGPITSKLIASAAKRIYGSCQRVVEISTPNERAMGEVAVTYSKSDVHKLTVAHDGNIRIKTAIDSSPEEVREIVTAFKKVAQEALKLNLGTLRGHVKNDSKYNDIVLYTDSKNEHHCFKY